MLHSLQLLQPLLECGNPSLDLRHELFPPFARSDQALHHECLEPNVAERLLWVDSVISPTGSELALSANCRRSGPRLDIPEPVVQAQLRLGMRSTNIIHFLSTF